MRLAHLTFETGAALAPMAGVADRAFRQLCREMGAVYTVGEMVSAKGLLQGSAKTRELLEMGPGERPGAVQLFGDEPDVLARAAEAAMAAGPDVIDLNMGCPAPKIAGNRAGSALMKDPELAARIIRSVKAASPVPVTVKFRKGWDGDSVNAVEFAKRAEAAGASAVCIHGRTRQQMYAPPVDLDCIRQVKQAVRIPVIGNGDIDSVESAVRMYEQTGCDLVMIGRGALGHPWLFAQLKAYFETGALLPEPPLSERMAVMKRHVRMICACKGERTAMKEARGHASWYMKGLRGAAALRRQAGCLREYADIERLAELVLESCATAAIEEVCDRGEAIIRQRYPGRALTSRYSPGYGDLPVTVQGAFLDLLDAPRRLGLCATGSSILTPRKSVTAVIGLSERPQPARVRGCAYCQMREHCPYRKGGTHCGEQI